MIDRVYVVFKYLVCTFSPESCACARCTAPTVTHRPCTCPTDRDPPRLCSKTRLLQHNDPSYTHLVVFSFRPQQDFPLSPFSCLQHRSLARSRSILLINTKDLALLITVDIVLGEPHRRMLATTASRGNSISHGATVSVRAETVRSKYRGEAAKDFKPAI